MPRQYMAIVVCAEWQTYHGGSGIYFAWSGCCPGLRCCLHGETRAQILNAEATGAIVPATMGNTEARNHQRLGDRVLAGGCRLCLDIGLPGFEMCIVVFYLGPANIGIRLVALGFFICHRDSVRLFACVAHCRWLSTGVSGAEGGENEKGLSLFLPVFPAARHSESRLSHHQGVRMSASAVVSQCQDGLCRAKRFAVYHELEKVAKNSTKASARPSNPRSGSALVLEYACNETGMRFKALVCLGKSQSCHKAANCRVFIHAIME